MHRPTASLCIIALTLLALACRPGEVSDPSPAETPEATPSQAEAPAETERLDCTAWPPGDEVFEGCALVGADGEITVATDRLPPELWGEGDGEVVTLRVDGALRYAHRSGRSVEVLPFDNGPDPWIEDRARFLRDGKVGFVDPSLHVVIEATWDFAFPFEDGLARVCTGCGTEPAGEHSIVTGGLWGVIDLDGEIVVPVEHERDELP